MPAAPGVGPLSRSLIGPGPGTSKTKYDLTERCPRENGNGALKMHFSAPYNGIILQPHLDQLCSPVPCPDVPCSGASAFAASVRAVPGSPVVATARFGRQSPRPPAIFAAQHLVLTHYAQVFDITPNKPGSFLRFLCLHCLTLSLNRSLT